MTILIDIAYFRSCFVRTWNFYCATWCVNECSSLRVIESERHTYTCIKRNKIFMTLLQRYLCNIGAMLRVLFEMNWKLINSICIWAYEYILYTHVKGCKMKSLLNGNFSVAKLYRDMIRAFIVTAAQNTMQYARTYIHMYVHIITARVSLTWVVKYVMYQTFNRLMSSKFSISVSIDLLCRKKELENIIFIWDFPNTESLS